MKSYLSLIPISARAHKQQNRMTFLCIVIAVFLVTGVFSMADMGVRMEMSRLLEKHGAQTVQDLSASPAVQTLYTTAAVLSILILIAGVLMISGSINSNVAQRTRFFGMMRCIGMSRQQIIRFVRLEALNWCKTAVPAGVSLGVVVTWILCAILRFVVGGEFSAMPLFGISPVGILAGILLGVVTVLVAAGSPARKAARVSPVTAATGNVENTEKITQTGKTGSVKVETALGFHHAVSSKKNLMLMTGSFALSIILFLTFFVLINLVDCLMPQTSNMSDLDITASDSSQLIDSTLPDRLSGMNGVKRVFGRRSQLDTAALVSKDGFQSDTVDLISYDDFDLDCLAKDGMLRKGSDLSKIYGNSHSVLAVWDPDTPLETGDTIQIGGEELEIAGMLRYNPFSSDGSTGGKVTIITSGDTFTRLTGVSGYSLVLIQTTDDATDADVDAIRDSLDGNLTFHDGRDQRTTNTYNAFKLFVYGFLTVITLVTVLNIMNSISMSVSARTKQYGVMRAVGMDEHQITRMIAAEAFTYAVCGCVAGCAAGLAISKLIYDLLITPHFSYAVWSLPVVPLIIILLCVFASAAAAVYGPARRICSMEITDILDEL